MTGMSVIHAIRCVREEGASVAAIARELGISELAVHKYLREVDLSGRPPVRRERPSRIDRWVPLVGGWLAEDRRTWSKQRHTATRIHRCLVDECGADVSLATVTRKVRELKREFGLERQRGFLDLPWHPGEAQAGFGQSDVYWKGVRRRMHCFVLSFPHSNTAAGVGRRRRSGEVRYTEVFRRFRAHYGFDSSLCNPHAGHEKGNVEAKVGAIRRALFVPVPSAWSFEGFNAALFDKCMGLAEKPHYRKDGREIELFAHDRAALLPLPDVAMDVVEYRRMKADKYGIIVLERRHRYLAGAEHAGRELIVGLRARSVEILDAKGRLRRDARTRLRRAAHEQPGAHHTTRDAMPPAQRMAQQPGARRAAGPAGRMARPAGRHRPAGPSQDPAHAQPRQRLGTRRQGHGRHV